MRWHLEESMSETSSSDGGGILDEILSQVPEGKPLRNKALGEQAEKTIAQGDEAEEEISRISVAQKLREHLQSIESTAVTEAVQFPPSYDECMNSKEFAEEIAAIKEIVDRYRSGYFDPSTMDSDILMLAAMLTRFGAHVNYADSLADDAESTFKTVRSRKYINAKIHADLNRLKASGELLVATAEVESEKYRLYQSRSRSISTTIRGFYFGAKSMLEMLNSVAARTYGERKFQQ